MHVRKVRLSRRVNKRLLKWTCLGVIKPNTGADADYDQMTSTIKRIERELEVHLREMEALFGGKVGLDFICCYICVFTLSSQCKLSYHHPGVSNEKYQIQVGCHAQLSSNSSVW